MIEVKTRIVDETAKVVKAAEKADFKNFSHAAASLRKTVIDSIEKADGPSAPGTPPHTHKRKFLSRSIAFDATKEGAVIGPRASIVGIVGTAHEFGGRYKGGSFARRPFMQPALMKSLSRFAGEWKGSIGN